jgi:hypothetical protein
MAIPLLPGSSPLCSAAPFQLPILAPLALLITPLYGHSRKHRFQQYLCCCLRIRSGGNMFTEPLPRNGYTRYNMHGALLGMITDKGNPKFLLTT